MFKITSKYFIQRWPLLTFPLEINGRRCKNNIRLKGLLFNGRQSFNFELKISSLWYLLNICFIERHPHSFLFALFLVKIGTRLSWLLHPGISYWFWGSWPFQLPATQDPFLEFLHFGLIEFIFHFVIWKLNNFVIFLIKKLLFIKSKF